MIQHTLLLPKLYRAMDCKLCDKVERMLMEKGIEYEVDYYPPYDEIRKFMPRKEYYTPELHTSSGPFVGARQIRLFTTLPEAKMYMRVKSTGSDFFSR